MRYIFHGESAKAAVEALRAGEQARAFELVRQGLLWSVQFNSAANAPYRRPDPDSLELCYDPWLAEFFLTYASLDGDETSKK